MNEFNENMGKVLDIYSSLLALDTYPSKPSSDGVVKIVGVCMARAIMHTLGIQAPGRPKFDSLEGTGRKFVVELATTLGVDIDSGVSRADTITEPTEEKTSGTDVGKMLVVELGASIQEDAFAQIKIALGHVEGFELKNKYDLSKHVLDKLEIDDAKVP